MPKVSQLEATYDYIRNKLTRGELEPGEEIGVSPALVQHALGQLEKAGLVECRAQSGTYVRELTAEEFANLCDLRELIEPYAAARAAERITEEQLSTLERSCERYHNCEMRISQSQSARELWNIHSELIDEERIFHGTILSAAGNELLTTLIQSLRLLAHVRHDFAKGSLVRNSDVAAEHQRIVEALQAHDTELARSTMLEHIHKGRDVLKQRLLENSVKANKLVSK